MGTCMNLKPYMHHTASDFGNETGHEKCATRNVQRATCPVTKTIGPNLVCSLRYIPRCTAPVGLLEKKFLSRRNIPFVSTVWL